MYTAHSTQYTHSVNCDLYVNIYFSEIESDTESLFESKVPYRSPHMKLLKQKPISSKSKTRTK